MSRLRVTLEPATRERVVSGDAAVLATVVNGGDRPELFHRDQAQRGSLVLQVEDGSGRRVLLPPPSPPDERDLAPASPLAPGESITFRYAGFLDARRAPGRYRVRWFSSHEALGGSRETPLQSDWTELEIERPERITRESPVLDVGVRTWRFALSIGRYLISIVGRYFCRAVLEKR